MSTGAFLSGSFEENPFPCLFPLLKVPHVPQIVAPFVHLQSQQHSPSLTIPLRRGPPWNPAAGESALTQGPMQLDWANLVNQAVLAPWVPNPRSPSAQRFLPRQVMYAQAPGTGVRTCWGAISLHTSVIFCVFPVPTSKICLFPSSNRQAEESDWPPIGPPHPALWVLVFTPDPSTCP